MKHRHRHPSVVTFIHKTVETITNSLNRPLGETSIVRPRTRPIPLSNDVIPVPSAGIPPEEDNFMLSQWLEDPIPIPIQTVLESALPPEPSRRDIPDPHRPQWFEDPNPVPIPIPIQTVLESTLPSAQSRRDTPDPRIPELLQLMERQESLEAGQKALVDHDILRWDHVYASSGDLGRWFMNRTFRPSVAGRNAVCSHLEWLVSEMVSVYPLSVYDVSYQPGLDQQTGRLIRTLEILVDTYPLHDRLQRCLSRAKVIGSHQDR